MTRQPAAPRVLFLDFDGVLHPTPAARTPELASTGVFDWLESLGAELDAHPDVRVVVHSTWRYIYSDKELRDILREVRERFLGSTPPGPRYESIQAWLGLNSTVTDYRILDDETTEFPRPLPGELIVCDPAAGVTGSDVIAALRRWLAERAQ